MPHRSPVPLARPSRWAAPALAAALLLPLAGCGGSDTTSAASSSSAPPASSAAPSAPAPSTAAPSAPSTTAPSAQATGPNAAVCTKLQNDATTLVAGGVTKDPKVLAGRLEKLASLWKADAADSKDAKLKASVDKAATALTAAAESTSGGKKVSLEKIQAQLKSAGEGLRAACPTAGTAGA